MTKHKKHNLYEAETALMNDLVPQLKNWLKGVKYRDWKLMSNELTISQKQIENKIFVFRDTQVMIDRDLADMYQVETRVLNQAVKRNIERFPEAFRFQLIEDETNELVTNCDRFGFLKSQNVTSSSRSQNVTLNKSGSKRGQNIKYLPYAFTEQGVAMLSAVLRSDVAVKVSIQIINAFVEMRKLIANHSGLLQRMEGIERKQLETDQKFEKVFKALESKDVIPTQGIFFEGEKLTDLLKPLELGWKERRTKELALMEDLMPQLKKLAQGREISGIEAYE